MSDCSYVAMSNHKLTVANLCVKSNSMWTNFADNGKIHKRMYNVCTMYTTAVGVILARQLARFRYVFCSLRSHGTRDKAGSIIDRCYRERLAWKCSARCAHTAHASLMGAYAPKRSANRALSWEGQRSSDNIWAIVHMSDARRALAIFNVCNEWRVCSIWVCAVIS